MKKKILFSLIIGLLFSKNIYAAELTDMQRAIYDTALAFYDRGPYIQYGDKNMTYSYYSNAINFTTYNYSPEDATENSIQHLSCDSFATFVYMNTFSDSSGNPYLMEKYDNGVKSGKFEIVEQTVPKYLSISKPGSKYYNPDMAVYYNGNPQSNIETEKQRIRDLLEPGDLIITGDHTMLYLGNDLVMNGSQIHSNGSFSNYSMSTKHNTYNPIGAVGMISLENAVLNQNTNAEGYVKDKYVFSEEYTEFGIIRPLNEITRENSNYKISDATKFRMKYPNLVVTKTASVRQYDSINPGEKITYTIKLKNVGNKTYENLVVNDLRPYNTKIISTSNGATINDRNITWTVSVPKGEVTLTYTVMVYVTYGWEKIITADNARIDGANVSLPLNNIKTYADVTMYPHETTKLVNKIKNKSGNTVTNTDNIITIAYSDYNEIVNAYKNKTINDVVDSIFDLGSYTVPTNADNASSAVKNDLGKTKVTYRVKDNANEILVENLIGGRYTLNKAGEDGYNDLRIKRFVGDNAIMPGDVIFIHDDEWETDTYVRGQKNLYLYLGNNEFATISNNKVEIIDNTSGEKLIDSLLGQNSFAVLRPSYLLSTLAFDVNNDKSVNNTDAKIIAKYIVDKTSDVTNEKINRVDMNSNNQIKMNDVVKMIKHINS